MNLRRSLMLLTLSCLAVFSASCAKSGFEIRDVDPGQPGEVRSLGPESQDAIRIAQQMGRDLLASSYVMDSPHPPTVVVLPLNNDTRFPFNKEIFSRRLRAELNTTSNGQIRFVARDVMEDVLNERDAKRAGEIDYDPDRRAPRPAGADFFLRGEVTGLATASRQGQADYLLYTFSLIDTETGIELWQDLYETKREGRDDVLYR
ncbi:MAG: CsgG/HfaB family protein [Sumerlaeia bacterium]